MGEDDLFCTENIPGADQYNEVHNTQLLGPRTSHDTSVIGHDRALENLLHLQRRCSVNCISAYTSSSTPTDPASRKVVTSWMLDVCEEQSCEHQVFMVATHLLDKFLSCVQVKKSQLQLVATVCLLLASKLRQCTYLSAELLAYYTDNSITKQEITQWELLMVAKLGWDLCSVTAMDFIDVLLRRLSVTPDSLVRSHAVTYAALAATDPELVGVKPGVVAAACVVYAVHGPYPHLSEEASEILAECLKISLSELQRVLDLLCKTLDSVPSVQPHADVQSLSDDTMRHLHVTENVPPPNKQLSRQMQIDPNYVCYSPAEQEIHNDSLEEENSPNNVTNPSDYEGYETPTDVNDITLNE